MQRALALHGTELMGREIFVDAASNRPGPPPLPAGKPVEGCWFCLSNPNADIELVASVGASPQILLRIRLLTTSSILARAPSKPAGADAAADKIGKGLLVLPV